MLTEHELRHETEAFVKGYLDGYNGDMSRVTDMPWNTKQHHDYESGYVKGNHHSIIDQCKK